MEMDLAGIKNQNEYYTNHYFTSIFKENAEDTITAWKNRAKEEECTLPWNDFRDTSRQYYRIREKYLYSKNEGSSRILIQELATLYLNTLGYGGVHSVNATFGNELTVPVFNEVTKSNGAPLLWSFLCVAQERGEDILQSKIFAKSDDEEADGDIAELCNEDILAKLFFAGEEAPRFIILIGINQIALIDRNKWNEKRFLQFDLEEIFSRHSESAFMAVTVLLHKESLCPSDGACVLDSLDENSHKHSAGVSDALKYALRECIEILGNEVIYDMKTRQGIDIEANPIDASELTLECLRYMYRFLFMLFIEARPELGYAPMKSQTYVQGYSLEGLRDICDRLNEMTEVVAEGYYIDDTISELFRMIYEGYPGDLDSYKKAIEIEKESMHDAFTIEALKAHIFDPEYTKLITHAKIRNCAMLQIIDLMSISRGDGKNRAGRISYSALGINQLGAVYEALLSYRGFIAKEDLYEVQKADRKLSERDRQLTVGYFIPERELDNYTEEERVRVNDKDPKSPLRKYEQGCFIYRLAGREREKSASYYTPEVLTKCLVKYALKELLKDKSADEILELTICEPAMGSAAFLNEAINQIAEAYLNKKQEELGETIAFDKRFEELQKVKMFIADRNVYGVDLNPIAVELAEVSLWLNTIYKGAYVPWFGTQLVCGNSLIGARRQVYPTSKLTKGKWYEEAPVRVTPGEARLRKGQKKTTKGIYHFLLGDPGMANYTDKVIKGLEAENIKKINAWRKEFTKSFSEDDIETLLKLSELIDDLWSDTVDMRKRLNEETSDALSVYGHIEEEEGSHLSIREKDAIYQSMFKTEHAQNAGPYARLNAAMDYWCALWFWPIDKADLLPSRQEFLLDMSMILEGGISSVTPKNFCQMNLFDDAGNQILDATGNYRFHVEGSQLALELQLQINKLPEVNLDNLRKTETNPISGERLAIANQIAEEQRFQHWELEFADVFEERGGFDLVIGNPPWIKLEWNEQNVIADRHPMFAIKGWNATETTNHRTEAFKDAKTKALYISEYISINSEQAFINAVSNYSDLKGQQTNLFKCFLPISWMIGRESSISAFVHPNGVFDDPKGGLLRTQIYKRLSKHFRFVNKELLFAEVSTSREYSLNVYCNAGSNCFDLIANLVNTDAIDDSYNPNCEYPLRGLYDEDGKWCHTGHPERIIKIGQNELKVFAKLLDGDEHKWQQARLLILHTQSLFNVIKIFADSNDTLANNVDNIFVTELWHETNAQKDKTISRNIHFPNSCIEMIYSGAHIGVANPLFKTSRRICDSRYAFDPIDLTAMEDMYFQRCNYVPACELSEYYNRAPMTPWGINYLKCYKILLRRMLNQSGERTLMSAIAPPDTAHINTVFGITLKNNIAYMEGLMASIPYDFYIKSTGKSDGRFDTLAALPMLQKSKFKDEIVLRSLMLNCLSSHYAELWEKEFPYIDMKWSISDGRLNNKVSAIESKKWKKDYALVNDYERRQALIEIDVLVAMALGMTLNQLISIYNILFPVLQKIEDGTWYDACGRTVFTCSTNLPGVGLERSKWESELKGSSAGYVYTYTVEDDTKPIGVLRKRIDYVAPYDIHSRELDYMTAWRYFEEKYR